MRGKYSSGIAGFTGITCPRHSDSPNLPTSQSPNLPISRSAPEGAPVSSPLADDDDDDDDEEEEEEEDES